MKQRFHDALLGIVGLAGVAFFALSGASCEGPKMQCAVGHGPFTIVYQVTSGDASCYENAYKRYGHACADYDLDDDNPDCAGLSKVEHVGFNTYLGVRDRVEKVQTYKDKDGNDIQYTVVEAAGADYNTRKIAVQSSTMGGLYQERRTTGADANDKPYAFGEYTSFPDSGDLCYAGTGSAALAAAEMNLDAVDADHPAVHYRQSWSDLRFFVTTNVPGTQVVGKMKFDDVTAGCSAEFKFTGLYPAVFCGAPVTAMVDHDNDPATPDKEVLTGYDPDNEACDPKADPASGRITGSGINPDFETYCHPEYLHCVLKDGTALVE